MDPFHSKSRAKGPGDSHRDSGGRAGKSQESRAPVDPHRTLTLVRSWDRSRTSDRAPNVPAKSATGSLLGYALAAAAGALLVAFGILIGGLVRDSEHRFQRERPQLRPSASSSSPSPAADTVRSATIIRLPEYSNPNSVSRNGQTTSEDAPVVIVKGKTTEKASVHLRAASRQDERRPRETAEKVIASPAGASDPTSAPMRYCTRVEDTIFRQSPSAETDGPDDLAARAPRADAGLMRLLLTVSADDVVAGRPVLITVSFENGGDTSVHLRELEESTSGGGLRPIAGAALPASVLPGGLKELYRYPLTPKGGSAYTKRFVAVDRKGDSWKAGLDLAPCPN